MNNINFILGDSKTDPKLANGLCGSPSAPAQFSTTQRYARVEMTTDGAGGKAGFKIDVVASKDYCTFYHCVDKLSFRV